MLKNSLAFASISILLTGCITAPNITLTTPFDSNYAQKMLADGTNTVKGSALIRQNGGGIVTCAGNDVFLIPNTEYANQRMLGIYKSNTKGYSYLGANFTPNYPEYLVLQKKTICDAQGFFKFNKVSDGTFYAVTSIRWRVSDYQYEGGVLMLQVTVKDGETAEVVLTP